MVGAGLGLVHKLRSTMDMLFREALKFGAIGGIGFVVDIYVYNVLLGGLWPVTAIDGPLHDKTVTAKVISTIAAMIVTWLGNRYWTFRHRRGVDLRREVVLFTLMNLGGMAIALGCLGFSHYVLDLTSRLADNISSQGVGLVLGTLFRFWAYRTFVFNDPKVTSPDAEGLVDITIEDAVLRDVTLHDAELRDEFPTGELPVASRS